MSPGLEHFAVAFAAHASFDAIKAALHYVSKSRPDLEEAAKAAAASGSLTDVEKIFREAVGVIVAAAGAGAIHIDGNTINALNGVQFDHQHGTVNIGNSVVSAKVLVTGGGAGATGQTVIAGNTSLRSQGTSIEIGHGASIVMTGGASIKQT